MGAPAQAGPVEQMVELVFGPADSPVMVARFINGGGGLLFSQDRGSTWQMQCNTGFLQPSSSAYGPMVVLANGTLLLPTSQGMFRGDLKGCGWQMEDTGAAHNITDLVIDPNDANAAFAVITGIGANGGGSSLQRRSADGKWSVFGAPDDRPRYSVRVTKNGSGRRIYEAVSLESDVEDGGTRSYAYLIRSSDDGGQVWRGFPSSFDGTLRVVGIDPKNADTIAVVVSRTSAKDTVMISRDRGETLKPYLELGEFGGLVWLPDGRLFIGDLGDSQNGGEGQGVWATSDVQMPAKRMPKADYPVQCLAYRAASDELYACQRFWLGKVDRDSGAYTTLMKFTTVNSFVSCDGLDEAAACERQLCGAYCGAAHFASAPVCAAYDKPGCGVPVAREEAAFTSGDEVKDAGTSSTAGRPATAGTGTTPTTTPRPAADGGSAGAAPPAAVDAGCGCSVPRSGPLHVAQAWLLLTGLALFAWRRRRAR